MKKRRYKQLLASAIACSMVFSGVPATAYAAENGTVQEVVQEEDQLRFRQQIFLSSTAMMFRMLTIISMTWTVHLQVLKL